MAASFYDKFPVLEELPTLETTTQTQFAAAALPPEAVGLPVYDEGTQRAIDEDMEIAGTAHLIPMAFFPPEFLEHSCEHVMTAAELQVEDAKTLQPEKIPKIFLMVEVTAEGIVRLPIEGGGQMPCCVDIRLIYTRMLWYKDWGVAADNDKGTYSPLTGLRYHPRSLLAVAQRIGSCASAMRGAKLPGVTAHIDRMYDVNRAMFGVGTGYANKFLHLTVTGLGAAASAFGGWSTAALGWMTGVGSVGSLGLKVGAKVAQDPLLAEGLELAGDLAGGVSEGAIYRGMHDVATTVSPESAIPERQLTEESKHTLEIMSGWKIDLLARYRINDSTNPVPFSGIKEHFGGANRPPQEEVFEYLKKHAPADMFTEIVQTYGTQAAQSGADTGILGLALQGGRDAVEIGFLGDNTPMGAAEDQSAYGRLLQTIDQLSAVGLPVAKKVAAALWNLVKIGTVTMGGVLVFMPAFLETFGKWALVACLGYLGMGTAVTALSIAPAIYAGYAALKTFYRIFLKDPTKYIDPGIHHAVNDLLDAFEEMSGKRLNKDARYKACHYVDPADAAFAYTYIVTYPRLVMQQIMETDGVGWEQAQRRLNEDSEFQVRRLIVAFHMDQPSERWQPESNSDKVMILPGSYIYSVPDVATGAWTYVQVFDNGRKSRVLSQEDVYRMKVETRHGVTNMLEKAYLSDKSRKGNHYTGVQQAAREFQDRLSKATRDEKDRIITTDNRHRLQNLRVADQRAARQAQMMDRRPGLAAVTARKSSRRRASQKKPKKPKKW